MRHTFYMDMVDGMAVGGEGSSLCELPLILIEIRPRSRRRGWKGEEWENAKGTMYGGSGKITGSSLMICHQTIYRRTTLNNVKNM